MGVVTATRCGRVLGQLLEQRLRVLQVLRVEALGKPGVDGGEEITGFLLVALLVP